MITLAEQPLRSAPSCERNQAPLGEVLSRWVDDRGLLLELGSGTGQHAAYLIDRFEHLTWLPSDRAPDFASIVGWAATASASERIRAPQTLDVDDHAAWAQCPQFDALLTVNTLHIMPWSSAEALFASAASRAAPGVRFLIYGPFHRYGHPTSEGNAVFDTQLRAEGTGMGIRDLEALRSLAARTGWLELAHYQMPANNQMLVLERSTLELAR